MKKIRKPKDIKSVKEIDTFGDTISVFPTGYNIEGALKGIIFESMYRTVIGKKRIVLYEVKQLSRIISKLTEIKKWMEQKP
jgi:hypothetical protein